MQSKDVPPESDGFPSDQEDNKDNGNSEDGSNSTEKNSVNLINNLSGNMELL